MIVVDTNILGYMFLTSERSAQVERVYQLDPDWAVPLLWRSELRNVLAMYLRKKIISFEDANLIMDEAARLVYGREYDVPSYQVLKLVTVCNCSAYDCEFVALAVDLGVQLVTVDKKVIGEFPNIALTPDHF